MTSLAPAMPAAAETAQAADVRAADAGPRRLGHVPELDGIRGIAVLMTVVAHSFFLVAPGGGLTGVALFFVLSGFLITTILVTEWERTGGISLRRFYARRALRLLPAIFAVLAVYLLLAFFAFSPVALGQRLWAAVHVATYFGNWQNATGWNLAELSHTWSLAVEDQFYFAWPAMLIGLLQVVRTRSAILWAVLGLAVLLAAWRAAAYGLGFDWHRIYYGTDMVGSSLLIGCLGGLAFTWGISPATWRHGRAIALLALAALGSTFFLVSQHSEAGRAFLATVGFPAIALASIVLILVVAVDRRAAAWLGHPVLVFFGRISYALYLWHLLAIQAMGKILAMPELERSVLSIPVAIALATLSYAVVEQPFLRLKGRFSVVTETSAGPAATVHPAQPA